jgi:hypothetical protein
LDPNNIKIQAANNINLIADIISLKGTVYEESAAATDSDANLKHNITLLSTQYKQLFNALIPRLYQYNNGTSNRIHIGFIAQEVEEAINNAGLTT